MHLNVREIFIATNKHDIPAIHDSNYSFFQKLAEVY